MPRTPARAASPRTWICSIPWSSVRSRAALQDQLRGCVTPGAIDVNIMTKLDRDHDRSGRPLPEAGSDALSALRGFMNSRVRSSVVLSAGMNRRLFAYLADFAEVFPDDSGALRKRIILKVSDFRSALVQGKLLAKLGLHVSEFRMESGLNCGGHAFGGKGQLLRRIAQDRPGSNCPKGHLVANTEFTAQPICTASRAYQRRKIEQIAAAPPPLAPQRPHMFIKEVSLHVDRLRKDVGMLAGEPEGKLRVAVDECTDNLLAGVQYYRELARELLDVQRGTSLARLDALQAEIVGLVPVAAQRS